nr:hypothetical protein [Tanacetum cinerariifolium]
MIVEYIHIRFDEIKEVSDTSVANDTSGLIPQRQKASDYDNSNPIPQLHNVYSSADAHVSSQQELDLLFGPLYDEFFNAGSNPQDKQPTTNIQPTSAPSTPTFVHAEENHDNQAEKEHLPDVEFTNPFCAPAQDVAESSSHNEAMVDSAWIEAMKEELHQFDKLQVWELVDKPFGKSVIRLKWLWKNKKDKDQTVIRNKARLVAKMKALYGLKQAPKAWYDELSKFLTSKGFTKVDLRCLLWGKSNSFLGLQIHQSPRGIFINQAKYALEILHKHGMEKGQSIGTPMAMKPKLDADLSGNLVDQTDYRSKIRSLMYLTSSRPVIVQAICFCARYQSRPTEKHLKEVKRIFRYLRGNVNIGLWYPMGSSFGLTAFLDADHAGCIDSRKSTSKGMQFLGDKLVSWMSKK